MIEADRLISTTKV